MFSIIRFLSPLERKTFILHLLYSILDGFCMGVIILNEYVFIKSMQGSNMLLAILFQISVIVLLFSVPFTQISKRFPHKKKLLRISALITRLPLILIAFFPENIGANDIFYHYIFLMLFLLFYLATPLVLPIINLFLKQNYHNDKFGKLFSYATSLNKIFVLITTFIYGYFLDISYEVYHIVLPLTGIAGILGVFIISYINYIPEIIQTKESIIKAIQNSFYNMVFILKSNKPFLIFQIGLMIYGFAFMLTYSVITIFFENVLHLNYSSLAFYKNTGVIISIISLPFFGKFIGNLKISTYGMISFTVFGLYILFVALTESLNWKFIIYNFEIYPILFVAFVFQGLFIASMSLLWSIGSVFFGESKQADSYQSLHLTLTGVRGIFAPLLGIVAYEYFGHSITFTISIFLLIIGILTMKTIKVIQKEI